MTALPSAASRQMIAPDVSIICPAYNEADGIETAIDGLRECLDGLSLTAEVLLINDGSTDGTVAAAVRAIHGDPRFRILSHRINLGRGRAMRTGFLEARGRIIITTEADLSWGRDVVPRMLEAFDREPQFDAVFASPHLPGGGYRNVPWHRIVLSRFGNRLLRALYPSTVSMTTGMTRAYRASAIKGHTFSKDGKELHLEIAHRLVTLGYRLGEVPAVLSWPDRVSGRKSRHGRTNWKAIQRIVVSHLAYGFLQGISRVFGPAIVFLTLAIAGFAAWAVRNAVTGGPSIFLVMLTGVMLILWTTLVVGYFLLIHMFQVEGDLWRAQHSLARLAGEPEPERRYYEEEPLHR